MSVLKSERKTIFLADYLFLVRQYWAKLSLPDVRERDRKVTQVHISSLKVYIECNTFFDVWRLGKIEFLLRYWEGYPHIRHHKYNRLQ